MFVKEQNMACTAGCPWNALEVKEGNFQMSGTRKCCTGGTSYDYYTSFDNLIVVGMFTKNGPVNATWTYRAGKGIYLYEQWEFRVTSLERRRIVNWV